ncbi:MAG: PstS family phosphate ABC transporter substrate-binding protein [Desulfovibrionaceae bacterium]
MKKILALVALFALVAGTAWAGSVEIKGSTTVLPFMQKVVDHFQKSNPDMAISLSGGGSSNGAKALIDGTCDIAMMSRDMKGKEADAAKANGREPVQFVVAYDCIVPVVNPANPVKDISTEQLMNIYLGKTTNWKDLGGKDAEIVVISRDTSSGTYDCWKDKIMGKDANGEHNKVFPGASLLASNGAVAQAVSKNPQAIGYVGLAYVNAELKGLSVNGISASVKTALDKSYPISRGLNCYTVGEPAGDVKTIMDFIMSPAGQKLAEEVGYIPVK